MPVIPAKQEAIGRRTRTRTRLPRQQLLPENKTKQNKKPKKKTTAKND
jgi:hypothetical protein